MPSAEGRGKARQAWDAYAAATNRVLGPVVDPVLGPAVKAYSASLVSDLFGFWLLWQLHGGYAGLRELGMSRAAIYRRVSQFRKVVGVHPDEFELPGVTLDLQAYLDGGEAVKAQRERGTPGA